MVYGGEDEIGRGKSLTPNRDIENNAPQMADSLQGKTQQLGQPFTMMTIVMRILLVLLMMTISMGLAVAIFEHFFIVGLREWEGLKNKSDTYILGASVTIYTFETLDIES